MNDTEHLASKIVQLSEEVAELDATMVRIADALEALESTASHGVDAWKEATDAFYGKFKELVERSGK